MSITHQSSYVYYHRHKIYSFPIHCNYNKRGDRVQFDNSAIGMTIRELRTEKKISQDVLSGLAGIARTHLTMIENGSKQPNFETLWRLALALDMKPSELVRRIEQNTKNHTEQ